VFKTKVKISKNQLKSDKIMNKPTIIAHPTTGEVITMFTGKDEEQYGRIRVDQTQNVIHQNMERIVRRTAFITLPEDVIASKLEQLVAGAEYKVAGKSGKLVVIESIKPFYASDKPKTKGKDGAVITSGGQPVFRDTVFSLDLEELDILLVSDATDADAVDSVVNATKEKTTVE